mgnify:CR=1 FL=1
MRRGSRGRLPPLFARRTKEASELLPELYLLGLSEGDLEMTKPVIWKTLIVAQRRFRRLNAPELAAQSMGITLGAQSRVRCLNGNRGLN